MNVQFSVDMVCHGPTQAEIDALQALERSRPTSKFVNKSVAKQLQRGT